MTDIVFGFSPVVVTRVSEMKLYKERKLWLHKEFLRSFKSTTEIRPLINVRRWAPTDVVASCNAFLRLIMICKHFLLSFQDERFNREVDIQTGYRTKALLCMPIKDSAGDVIGVAQVINKLGSEQQSFTSIDEKVSLNLMFFLFTVKFFLINFLKASAMLLRKCSERFLATLQMRWNLLYFGWTLCTFPPAVDRLERNQSNILPYCTTLIYTSARIILQLRSAYIQ